MSTPLTIKGYVIAIPPSSDEAQARVAIMFEDKEYRIIPRGAGVDLDDHLNTMVEANGICTETDGILRMQVRGYKVFDDDEWLDDDA